MTEASPEKEGAAPRMDTLPDVEGAGIPGATHGMQSMNPFAVGEACVDFFGRHPIGR